MLVGCVWCSGTLQLPDRWSFCWHVGLLFAKEWHACPQSTRFVCNYLLVEKEKGPTVGGGGVGVLQCEFRTDEIIHLNDVLPWYCHKSHSAQNTHTHTHIFTMHSRRCSVTRANFVKIFDDACGPCYDAGKCKLIWRYICKNQKCHRIEKTSTAGSSTPPQEAMDLPKVTSKF